MKLLNTYKSSFTGIHKDIWTISWVMFINRCGSMVLLFTTLYMVKDLHFTKTKAGIIMSFFGVGSIVGSYVGGWLADRYNQKKLMIFSLISCGLILLLITLTKNQYLIATVLFLYAFTSDSFRPSSSAYITKVTSAENRTRSISLYRLAINLGFSIGPAIGGFIAQDFGYKYLFVVDAFTSFAAALILFFYLPDVGKSTVDKNNKVLNDKTTSAYRDKHYLKFIILVALYGLCFFQIFASVPTYFKEVCNYTEKTIGYLLALNGALVVIIEMPLIAYLEKIKKSNLYILIGCLQIVLALGLLIISNGALWISILYTFFITLSEIFAMPFMMSYALSLPPKERQGQYSALYSIAYGISIILAPSVGLSVAEHYGFNIMFLMFITISSVIAYGFWKVVKNKSLD